MEEKNLKQIFVGKKFEKFEKKVFSIPAFLFGGMYFSYRKMLVHALLVSLVVNFIDTTAANLLNMPLMIIAILCIHIAVGLFFPLWYKNFYNNKVRKIMSQKSQSSEDDLIKFVQKSGGTSILYIIIFILINSVSINFLNNLIQSKSLPNSTPSAISNQEATSSFVEDVQFSSMINAFNSSQLFSGWGDDTVTYNCTNEECAILYLTNTYDELSADIYYADNNGEKTITSYKLYNNETNEDLSNYTDKDSIIKALGYYTEGTYEETLTLVEKDSLQGIGQEDNVSYTYYTYTFENEKGKQLEFNYKIYNSSDDKSNILEENKKYNVQFDVKSDMFGYEHIITDIENL